LSAPIATESVYRKIMTATVLDSRTANATRYISLRAEFDTAYRNLMDSSREYSAVLMSIPPGLSLEERQVRIDTAAHLYEDAQQRFADAVTNLNRFMINQIISSRSAIQLAAAHS
jgi:hypothetical protein